MKDPVNSGTVDWSGENPGIYLKEHEDGPWSTLAVFFRVVTSPYGRGVGMLILGAPEKAVGYPVAPNFCITDNQPLMCYLVTDYVSKFASFSGSAALPKISYLPMVTSRTEGNVKDYYMETLCAPDLEATLRWEGLGVPFAVDVPPELSSTGAHQMYSLFIEARLARVLINGESTAGKVFSRNFLGRRMNTAFLAFSETWVKPKSV